MKRSSYEIAPVLTVKDVADHLRVHPSTVYRLLKSGELPAFKVGHKWRFSVEAIEHWRFKRSAKAQ
jgi:excisionase family DNA binding protein